MSRSDSAAVSRRRLRSALRRLRAEAAETQKQVADSLFWSPSKLMRIEGGQVGVTPIDVKALLDHYGVDDESTVRIFLEMAKKSRERTLSSRYRDALSKEFADFLEQEEAAAVIRQYETKWIPGPLQTAQYARVAIRNSFLSEPSQIEEIVDKRVTARLERKALLTQPDGPEAHFIVDEAALWRHIGAEAGTEELMIDQLDHLKEIGANQSIAIQFVPFTLGAYRALRGPFVVLEFDDPSDDNLLYLENPDGEVLVREDPEQTAPYLEEFSQLEKRATPPGALAECVDAVVRAFREGAFGLPSLRSE